MITVSESVESADRTESDRAAPGIRPFRLLYAVGVWIAMVVLALLTATVRELLVAPVTGEDRAHVIGTLTLLVALAALVSTYLGRGPEHTTRELGALGLLWAGLTVAFEFGFGHYVAGDSWESLLGQYDVTAGRIWVLVPLFLLVSPMLFGRYLRR